MKPWGMWSSTYQCRELLLFVMSTLDDFYEGSIVAKIFANVCGLLCNCISIHIHRSMQIFRDLSTHVQIWWSTHGFWIHICIFLYTFANFGTLLEIILHIYNPDCAHTDWNSYTTLHTHLQIILLYNNTPLTFRTWQNHKQRKTTYIFISYHGKTCHYLWCFREFLYIEIMT